MKWARLTRDRRFLQTISALYFPSHWVDVNIGNGIVPLRLENYAACLLW